MNTGNIQEIISLFRKGNNVRPILLLGAGASFKSGIPLAADTTKRIAKASYSKKQLGQYWKNYDRVNRSDWMPYLKQQTWFKEYNEDLAEAFPAAVENLLIPKEFRKEFLLDMLEPSIPISDGYIALAEIIQKNLCWTVLTTNFDTLIYDSFKNVAPGKRIFEINRTSGELYAFRTYGQRQVVYLHGVLEYYTDKIEHGETKNLSSDLISRLRPCLSNGPLIVIGYRGAEESIMKHLLIDGISYCNNYSYGVYWCTLKDEAPHKFVTEFANNIGTNFKLVTIDGFDELIIKLSKELKEDYYVTTKAQISLDNSLPFDEQFMEDKSYEDLDENLLKVTLAKYFQRLSISSVKPENYIDFLISEHFLLKKEGQIHPSNACHLLFGRKITDKFPYAVIKFDIDDKTRTIFEGNLIEQFNTIIDYFNDENINPTIRIKKERESFDILAYQPRAITELLVNMLIHRDYSINEFSKIEYKTGQQVSYETPGGLPEKVISGIEIGQDGYFEPVRGLSQIRNKLLADIFYGIGSMDKVGSGMPDVKEFMRENSGEAKFKISENNKSLVCTLLQAIQKSPNIDNTAQPLLKTELYITNLLPFRVLPDSIFLFPTKDLSFMEIVKNLPKKDFLPIYLTDIHTNVINKKIISFADLEFYKEFFHSVIDFSNAQEIKTNDFISNDDQRRRFVWLVLKHFEFYLRQFERQGLHVDYKDKKAYFELMSGVENKITYISRLNRKATRAVVKRRETKTRVFHENEGISFGMEYLANQFALSIKPIYMFTKKDGKTPLESYLRSRYATSRMKFDRNKMVDDDLHFWLKYISQGKSSVNIGGNDIDNLILDTKYLESEVIVGEEV